MSEGEHERRAIRSRRLARCPGCGLTDALCICGELVPLAVRTRVIVVAHHKEIWKTTNTGRLAVQLLEGARLVVRGDREVRAPLALDGMRRAILYPGAEARVLTPDDAAGPPLALIVPDGSWAQARKVRTRDPLAQGAELVTLPPGARSRYALRKSPSDEALCTLEAIARAMGVLEREEVEGRMLEVFDAFVARQRAIRRNRTSV